MARPSRAGTAPLRILHVMDSLALAGMEYGVIKLVNRLDPARFAPMLCCLRTQNEATIPLIRKDIPVFEMHRNEGRDWKLVPRLAALMREHSVDLVHSHNWATFLYTVLAARRAPRPVVIHGEHGRESTGTPWKQTLASLVLARFVRHVTTVSESLSQELVAQWKLRPSRVTTIPNGVDLDRFGASGDSDELLAELKLDRSDRVILSIGRLRPVKDYPTLLRAFAIVRRRIPSARLLVLGGDFGTGTRTGLVGLAEELGVAGATRFIPPRQDVPDLLRLADVYVNCSIFEGMSNTILEAMAAGRPVVASAVGGNPGLVDDRRTGFLFPAGDPDALAQRLSDLLTDEERRLRMGAEGRRTVERHHTMERTVERYGRLYLECTGRGLEA